MAGASSSSWGLSSSEISTLAGGKIGRFCNAIICATGTGLREGSGGRGDVIPPSRVENRCKYLPLERKRKKGKGKGKGVEVEEEEGRRKQLVISDGMTSVVCFLGLGVFNFFSQDLVVVGLWTDFSSSFCLFGSLLAFWLSVFPVFFSPGDQRSSRGSNAPGKVK